MPSDPVSPSPPRVEVITSVQRRRRWTTAEKVRLVEGRAPEAIDRQPGMSVSYIARQHSSALDQRQLT
jgi:transposase